MATSGAIMVETVINSCAKALVQQHDGKVIEIKLSAEAAKKLGSEFVTLSTDELVALHSYL